MQKIKVIMFDCAIIGTGASGVSAALTLKALKRNFIWIGSKKLSPKIRSAEKIANYPGLLRVSGGEMTDAFLRQIESEGIEITEGKVNGVYPAEEGFSVMCGGEVFKAQSVILATGVETFKPVKGESDFLGRGVSYCAVCDGFLYKDKTIAVIIESAEEADEVKLLAKYARTVYLFVLKGDAEIGLDNVKKIDGRVSEIKGDLRVRSVVYGKDELPVDGVFVLKQAVAADALVYGLKAEEGRVAVDRACATSVKGVFAAGDCTGRPFQYAKAVGEGNVCAYSVNAYLNSLKK